ncbi:OB-fold domain-containing protein [Nonomuraea typhae]|uniref:OB-fold domain-containing protein n=1 Tax=Nonomuraea typhae TaxID=2603600 RepID=UPI001FE31E3A|nr:OB-fold domain-containing protein [Nonomuraea typhae]
MAGIMAYGSYLPAHRIRRSRIGEALGTRPAAGSRTVASYDEDTTTMGAEAARVALRGLPEAAEVRGLYFATADPVYLDRSNAAAVHAVLSLDPSVPAVDMGGAVRSGVGALRAGLHAGAPTLVVLSDIRAGLPGGADERDGGDGAAALVVGTGEVVAEWIGDAARTEEFLSRWRSPGERYSRRWEDRFVEEVHVPAGRLVLEEALKSAGLTAADVDHLVVAGASMRIAAAVRAAAGVEEHAAAGDLLDEVGETGTAHPALCLADILDRAGPGEVIALVVLTEGADALVFRTTDLLARRRSAWPTATQLEHTGDDLSYATFATWRGHLPREPMRRPLPPQTAAPAARRIGAWKLGLVGSRCTTCDTRHLPPQRVCGACRALDEMRPDPVGGLPATVSIATVDRLAWSPSPPLIYGTVDFDGGGRLQCEFTDTPPERAVTGLRVRMAVRRTHSRDGVHNYYWKARPERGEQY